MPAGAGCWLLTAQCLAVLARSRRGTDERGGCASRLVTVVACLRLRVYVETCLWLALIAETPSETVSKKSRIKSLKGIFKLRYFYTFFEFSMNLLHF